MLMNIFYNSELLRGYLGAGLGPELRIPQQGFHDESFCKGSGCSGRSRSPDAISSKQGSWLKRMRGCTL